MDTNTTVVAQAPSESKISALLARYPIIMQLLRFGAIGVINTALDFIILNVISKTLQVTSGVQLGQVNVIGFSLAVIQSYFWNRYWAFGHQAATLLANFVHLVLMGALGGLAVLMVLFGSNYGAPASFYLIILAIFVISEVVLWFAFGLHKIHPQSQAGREFIIFLVVSLIGLVINSVLITVISNSLHITANADLNKNLAKILATFASLIWNFIGYKLFVFKS